MATTEELDLVDELVAGLQTRAFKRRLRTAYYRGAQRLKMMGLSTPPEMRDLQTVINWCRTTVDALAERLDIEGFRSGDRELDQQLWDWWKFNNMRARADQGHIESFAQGSAFVVVGKHPTKPRPRYSVETSGVFSVRLSDLGDEVEAAVRYYVDRDSVERATLYLPDETVWLHRGPSRWVEDDRDVHMLGEVPVVPLTNRMTLDDPFGESEMTDVMSLVDAACRTATNLSTASETLAVPSRYVTGATEQDFIDPTTGEPVPVWEAYLGRLNALTDADAKVFQLDGADLKNFTETLSTYGKLVSSVTGLPLHYLGVTSDGNPTAADAIAAAEARHVKRAERKQDAFDSPWGKVQNLAHRIVNNTDEELLVQPVWRDAGTPTVAARTDAVVKLKQTGLLPIEGAWIELGWDQEKRDTMRALFSDDPLERMITALGAQTSNVMEDASALGTPSQPPPESGVNGF